MNSNTTLIQIFKNIVPKKIINIRRRILILKQAIKTENKFKEKQFEKLVESKKPVFLEFGSGSRKGVNGWTTIDITDGADISWDINRLLPIPDNSVDKIYSSHFLEHFSITEIQKILSECYRIIKPGGWISACVPDASIYINAYVNNSKLDENQFCGYKPAFHYHSKIDYVNYIAYLGGEHKHLFDSDNLVGIFKSCNFQNAKTRNFINELDLKERNHQSIYVEATK